MNARRITPTIALAAALFVGVSAMAQQTSAPSQQIPPQEARGDIDFPGGTVADYVAAIDKAFGAANAAIGPGVADVRVAPIKLTQVRREDALFILEAIDDTGSSDRWVAVSPFGNPSIARITLESRNASVHSEVRIWSLQRLTDGGARTEDILSAIETAVALIPGEPQIKFHRDTNLLMMRAPVEQLDAANQVLQALTQASDQRRDATARDKAEKQRAEQEKAAPE